MYIQQDCNNKPNQWASINPVNQPDIPKERHGHSLCSYNNKLYLFGGTPDGSSRLDDTGILPSALLDPCCDVVPTKLSPHLYSLQLYSILQQAPGALQRYQDAYPLEDIDIVQWL